MSKIVFVSLTNEILEDLGLKMLKIDFSEEQIANIEFTKDGSLVKNMFIAYRYMKPYRLRNKIISEVF